MKKYYIFILLTLLFACKKKEIYNPNYIQNTTSNNPEEKITPDDIETITPEEARTFYKNKEYEYEYRTGYSGSYEYNYDIIGFDENGNEVFGNINVEGKYGAGKIEDKNGNTYTIEVEWYAHGKLKGTDENGITYELTVE